MRYMTPERLRAAGLLLIEAAGFALLISRRLGGDAEIRGALGRLWAKARSL